MGGRSSKQKKQPIEKKNVKQNIKQDTKQNIKQPEVVERQEVVPVTKPPIEPETISKSSESDTPEEVKNESHSFEKEKKLEDLSSEHDLHPISEEEKDEGDDVIEYDHNIHFDNSENEKYLEYLGAEMCMIFPLWNDLPSQFHSNCSKKVYEKLVDLHQELGSFNLEAYAVAKMQTKLVSDNSGYVIGECNSAGKLNGVGLLLFGGSGTGYVKEGMWKNGELNGIARWIYSNGTYYSGEYLNDKWEGNGVIVYEGGNHYNGQWKNGFYHGYGTMYHKDGTAECGRWENNKYIGPEKQL